MQLFRRPGGRAVPVPPFDRGPYVAHYGPIIRNRQNERWKRIVAPNLRHVAGRRLCDLGAHDGRWTWAALEAGAAYVEAVEGRPELMERAAACLAGHPAHRWKCVTGDVFDWLEEKVGAGETFDTVMCLGLLYHVAEHFRLLRLMAALRPEAIIIDAALVPGDDLLVVYRAEDTARPVHAIPGREGKAEQLTGVMSQGLLAMWARNNGWKITWMPWRRADVADTRSLDAYFEPEQKPKAHFTLVMEPDGQAISSTSM